MMAFEKTRLAVAATALCLAATTASSATIVVSADEWALSDTGYANAGLANVDTYVQNIVAEFGPRLHAFSTNFSYTGAQLAASMANAGATYSTGLGITFDLPTLSTFDGILLGGNYLSDAEETVLGQFVAGGGSVYIVAGTGIGGAAAEAEAWNDFLSPFDIQLIGSYVGPTGNVAVSGDPLFSGVSQLYQDNANGMQLTSKVVCCASQPLYAVSRDSTTVIPLPASGLLFMPILLVCGYLLRRRARPA
jgi:hypothetical protein